MHDPGTQIFHVGPFMLYHNDPCTDGSDDSCGWFMRAKHGKKEVLANIVRAFESDWDRNYTSDSGKAFYERGLFHLNGHPRFSCGGVVVNLFFAAATEHFRTDNKHPRKRAAKFMRDNLFEILLFAENTFDSLHDDLVRTFQIGCNEKYTVQARRERIESIASCIYGWILRSERPWYRHPRWHVHHWEFTIHWRWFLPRWLDRRMYPESYASCE